MSGEPTPMPANQSTPEVTRADEARRLIGKLAAADIDVSGTAAIGITPYDIVDANDWLSATPARGGDELREALAWLEVQAKQSRTGISFDWVPACDGDPCGFRFMRRHHIGEPCKSIAEAIRQNGGPVLFGRPPADLAVSPSTTKVDAGEAAFPTHIGRLHLGERRSDGERLCSHNHAVPAGHPLYWPQQISQYDDSDPQCLEHAIEQAVDDNGYCEKCTSAEFSAPQVEGLTSERRDDYRGWQIEHNPPPIPTRAFDWTATHPSFDGEGDTRQVWGATWDAVRAEIDTWHEENAA